MAGSSGGSVFDEYDSLSSTLKQDMQTAIRYYAKSRTEVDSTEAGAKILKDPIGSRWKQGTKRSGVFGVAVKKALIPIGWYEDLSAKSRGRGTIYKKISP